MTTQVIAELDEIINLVEARIPANPRSPKNVRLRKGLEQELARYFRSLADAFPYSQVGRLYNKYVKESLGSETREMLDTVLATFDEALTTEVSGHLTTIYFTGSTEMITWGKTKAGIPIAYEGPPISQAVSWAEKEGARLVTQMDTETRRRLAQVVSDGIKNKRGVPGLARDIKREFADMSRFRSQLIARTETSNALSQASLDRMRDMGIDGKEWITVGDDRVSDECLANEAQRVIPANQAFTSGPMAPPQHPSCRCAIAPARLKGAERPEAPTIKDEPPVTRAAPAKAKTDTPEMERLFKDKLKAGKGKFDSAGMDATIKELRSVRLPDSHLATVNRIDVNTALLKRRAPGSMAAIDGGNNIVLASKVAQENIVHEIGHAVFKRKIFIRGNNDKYRILDIFKSSTKTGKGFVSQYAKSTPDEFFAESYAAFAKNPVAFTKLNKPMANLLKKYWK